MPHEGPVDPQFIPLACILAGCKPDHLPRATWSEGALTVVYAGHQGEPLPNVFTATQIAEFAADDIAGACACGLHERPAPGWYEQHIAPARQHLAAAAPAAAEPQPEPGDVDQRPIRQDPPRATVMDDEHEPEPQILVEFEQPDRKPPKRKRT
jgi:hypothetical protein